MTLIREASPADGSRLVAFFRETALRASTEFVLDRGPDFDALLRIRGHWRTFVALEGERVRGSVTALWHEGLDGDKVLVVGEIVDLRVAPEARGGPAAARLLGRAREALEETGADWVLCLIGDRNREARRLVSGGAGIPPLAALGRYASVHYPAWRIPRWAAPGGISVRRADAGDARVLAELARETSTGRRFAPTTLFPWPDPSGTHRGWIAEAPTGQPIGGLVVWDPMAVRRIRVRRYSSADQVLRGLMALAAMVGAATALPKVGEPLRLWASRWLGARSSAREVTSLLARTAIRAAAEEGQHVLQLNLEERDPLFGLLPALPRSCYWSTLYGRPLREPGTGVTDAAICHTDVALA
jgi:hypothetical protein